MPLKSKAQQRYMFARHPKIARRWEKEYGVPESLPEKKGSKRTYMHGSGVLSGNDALRKVGAL